MEERLKKSIEQLDGGMTLRDQFAMAALEEDVQKYMCGKDDWGAYRRTYTREQARYRFADAMMEARK